MSDFQSEEHDPQTFGPYVQITFHRNIVHLLQEFYGTILFADGFMAGGMVMQPGFKTDSHAQDRLASTLGIAPQHVADSGKAFVLTRYWKKIRTHKATASIKEQYVDDFKSINRSEPDNIITLFSKYGTHFVSEYEEGDFIYQIFVYQRDVFAEIEEAFPDDPTYRFGVKGSYYRKYTEPRETRSDGRISGYCSSVGSIMAASGDPVLSDVIPFLHDEVHRVDSILMILTDYSIAQKTDAMTQLISSKTILDSISERVFSSEDSTVAEAWNEVLRGALFQKYDKGSSPGFKQIENSTSLSFYADFNPDLVTNTASSYVSIIQAMFDLTDLNILNPSFVTNLYIQADVIELPSDAKVFLPGTENIYLICREFRTHSVNSSVPEVVVGSVDSDVNVQVIASSFQGVMKLTHISTQRNYVTYVGDSVFKLDTRDDITTVVSDPAMELRYPTPSLLPELYRSTQGEHSDTWMARSFVNGMQLLAMTVESVYALQIGESAETAQKSLKWMINVLGSARREIKLSTELEVVLSRCLLIQKLHPNSGPPLLLVPTLTFEEYKELYESLLESVQIYESQLSDISAEISRRMMQETTINSQQELNENILSIGNFLVGQVQGEAEYYEDVAEMHSEIARKMESELQSESETLDQLFNEVIEFSGQVQAAGDKLVDDVTKNQMMQVIGIVFEMATAIASMFVGGYGIATIPSEIQNIARVVEKVSYVTALAEDINTMYNAINDIDNIASGTNDDLSDLPDMSHYSDSFPTLLDWDDFDADVALYTDSATLGCCGGSAAEFKNKATKLSSRGRAYLESVRKISALQYEIMVNKMNADVAQQQKDRLDELSTSLSQQNLTDYQANTTDLFELGNILQAKANDVRMQLARTYLTMDAALQHYYLKPPTPLPGYDTAEIQSAASQQIADAIFAFEDFPASPHDLEKPIVYEIPAVRISALTSKSGFRHMVSLFDSKFQDYVRVRIREIRVTIDSIKSADTDDIYIASEYIGSKCRDRGLDREVRIFNTFSREYRYVYNYTDGSAIIRNNPSDDVKDKFAMMTPFGEWIFTIPEVESDNLNVNVKYSSRLTTVRIEFYVNIILHPAISSSYQAKACSDVTCLLDKVYQQTVTGNFDAVMALDAIKINDLWEQRYLHAEEHGGIAYNLTTDWMFVMNFGDDTFESRMTGILTSPLVSFLNNTPNEILMTIKMKDAVYESRAIKSTGEVVYEDPIYYESPIMIYNYNHLAKIHGTVDSQDTVAVNFDDTLVDMDIECGDIECLGDTEVTVMETAIEKYFIEHLHSRDYDLGTVDYDSSVTPENLQPREFFFTTGGFETSESGYGTLYLCIYTHYSTDSSDDIEVCELSVLLKDTDTVIPSGHTAALYVSSRVIFDIFLEDVTKTFGAGIVVDTIPNMGTWAASQLTGETSVKFQLSYKIAPTCTGPKTEKVKLDIPTAGTFSMAPNQAGSLGFSWKQTWENPLIFYDDYIHGSGISCTSSPEQGSKDFTLSISQSSVPSTSSDGLISFPKFPLEKASVSHGGGSGDTEKAADGVVDSLWNHLKEMNFKIDSISVFALTNLIFSNAKVINTTQVLLPGDLLVLGDITNDYNPDPIGEY
jgi:hypothetical protein